MRWCETAKDSNACGRVKGIVSSRRSSGGGAARGRAGPFGPSATGTFAAPSDSLHQDGFAIECGSENASPPPRHPRRHPAFRFNPHGSQCFHARRGDDRLRRHDDTPRRSARTDHPVAAPDGRQHRAEFCEHDHAGLHRANEEHGLCGSGGSRRYEHNLHGANRTRRSDPGSAHDFAGRSADDIAGHRHDANGVRSTTSKTSRSKPPRSILPIRFRLRSGFGCKTSPARPPTSMARKPSR